MLFYAQTTNSKAKLFSTLRRLDTAPTSIRCANPASAPHWWFQHKGELKQTHQNQNEAKMETTEVLLRCAFNFFFFKFRFKQLIYYPRHSAHPMSHARMLNSRHRTIIVQKTTVWPWPWKYSRAGQGAAGKTIKGMLPKVLKYTFARPLDLVLHYSLKKMGMLRTQE